MCIVVIAFVIKNSRLQNLLDEYEDMDDEERLERAAKKEADEKVKEEVTKKGKSHSYAVGEETGEILLEDGIANKELEAIPDEKPDSIQDAMNSRPYGIDSAFDVVESPESEETPEVEPEEQPASPPKPAKPQSANIRNLKKQTEEKEPQKVALPGEVDE